MANGKKRGDGIVLCNFVFGAIFMIILIISFTELIVPSIGSEKYLAGECNITRVAYPTELPVGDDGGPNWAECDCGRRCVSWTPCVSLFMEDPDGSGEEVMVGDNYYSYLNGECTFIDPSCPTGEDYRVIEQYMEESREYYLEYSNKTVECFISDDGESAYLVMDFNWEVAIYISVFSGIFALVCICLNLADCERQEKCCFKKKEQIVLDAAVDEKGDFMNV